MDALSQQSLRIYLKGTDLIKKFIWQKHKNAEKTMNEELPASILVVDDLQDNLKLLANMLSEKGYEVRSAIDGIFALKTARLDPPNLILLDIKMPNLDGYSVCDQLKREEKTKNIPIIFISALNNTINKVKAFQSGGVDYISKPFESEELLARVKAHLKIQNLQYNYKFYSCLKLCTLPSIIYYMRSGII